LSWAETLIRIKIAFMGLTVTPFALRVLFNWSPKSFVIWYWRRFFRTEMADCVFGRHAVTASREMREIANEFRAKLDKTGVRAPALHQLYRAIDEYSR
jgi:hypothetical protein